MRFENIVNIFESIKVYSFLQHKYTGILHVQCTGVSYGEIFVILVHTSRGKKYF